MRLDHSLALAPALALLAACASAPREPAAPAPQRAEPLRVVLFIGDGAGVGSWTAARVGAESLAVEQFRVVGLVDTRNSSRKVTDSAAGATVYATGVRTFNGAIGVGPDSLPRRTVLEIAEANGMATGLVTTANLTDASPASFAAHVPSRRLQPQIADQMLAQGIEVLMGGGRGFFDGSLRPDSQNLLPSLRDRYTYIQSPAELRSLDTGTAGAVLGLFSHEEMYDHGDAVPGLPEMTTVALDLLGRDPEGFFLMVESETTDGWAHENLPLDRISRAVLELDRAIQVALDYQARHPETLVVVLADHETGGLAVQADASGRLEAKYTTKGHTAGLVPLFARGPGAERFAGLLPNTRVGELLLDAVRRTAPAPAPASSAAGR